MIFTATAIPGCFVIELQPLADDRGWFARTYSEELFAKEIGQEVKWVQSNHSFTAKEGSVRGMHYQNEPYAECKLVRCVAGGVFDVVVDLRKDSSTYLKWFGVELNATNRKQIFIPEGCAHGFQTLTANAELIYQHSQFYTPASEGGILYNDPVVGIKWPLEATEISTKDLKYAPLKK